MAGAITFNFNPAAGSIADFSNTTPSTCSSGTQEIAGFTCTLDVLLTPQLPGIRKGVIEVDFTPSGGGTAEPVLYLYLSGLGSAPQITLSSATQVRQPEPASEPDLQSHGHHELHSLRGQQQPGDTGYVSFHWRFVNPMERRQYQKPGLSHGPRL